MRSIALFALFAFAAAIQSLKPITQLEEQNWIVVFHSNVTELDEARHFAKHSPAVQYNYHIGDFKGYSATMNSTMIARISQSPEVSFVEADQIMTASQSCGSQNQATWGLDRIDQRAVNLNGKYSWASSAGANVNSYVVDTGIYTANKDFEGRAVWGANFADTTNNDCNGHGTHVAGTMGSATWGVAKKTTLIAVKVLACNGSGSNAGVISGVQFTATDAKKRGKPAVANMSLGGGKSAALNTAVANAVLAGVTFIVAAGNDNADACNYSPASEPLAISVGSTTTAPSGVNQIDQRSSFSNFGACTDIFAPGSLITSTWIGSTTAEETISGTSMAAPHVAGAAALYLGANPTANVNAVRNALLSTTTDNVINLACGTNNACKSSPNRLLFTGTC